MQNATSPETAYTVNDYPYGFRLRCSIRFWIEYKPNHGFRIVSQTTNPKKPGTVWNAPKASPYYKIAAALRLDPTNGHVLSGGLSEYSDLAEYETFRVNYGATMTEKARESLDYFTAVKNAHEAKKRELGVTNFYDATGEQRREIQRATIAEMAAQREAGRVF